MFRHRSLSKLCSSVATIAVSLFVLSSAAEAATISCKYRDSTPNGEVDFGSGNHSFGFPSSNGIVTWNFSSVAGALSVTARVQGTLYLDALRPRCARLRINFQDSAFNNLQNTQVTQFCGPGFDANSSANKRLIDVTSLGNGSLNRVQLALGSGATAATTIDEHAGSMLAPSRSQRFWDRINNGQTDFGFNSHSAGGPASDALIQLFLADNGTVIGSVEGVLYWDDLFSGGTSRIITDFQNSAGTTLATRVDEINGTGGNANDIRNKVLVTQRFTSSTLSKIRLRVGRVLNGAFVNVVTRTYTLGCR